MERNSIKEIEERYQVGSIVDSTGMPLWPILRPYIFAAHRYKSGGAKLRGFNSIRIRSLATTIWDMLKSLKAIRRNFDIIYFSNSVEARLIQGLYRDKLLFGAAKLLQHHKQLYVERPTVQPPPRNLNGNPATLNSLWIDGIARAVSFFLRTPQIVGHDILNKIQEELLISINPESRIKQFLAYRIVFRFLLKIWKPKAIFETDYYNTYRMALNCEARKLKIPTFEFQHGVVTRDNPFYNFYYTRRELLGEPSYFFVWGDYTKEELTEFGYISQDHILPVGNSFLHEQMNLPILPAVREKWSDETRPIAIVTLQNVYQDRLITILKEITVANPDVMFLLLPRHIEKIHFEQKFSEPNLFWETEFNFYELSKVAKYHVSIYSACCLEAPYLGLQNILIDLDGLASFYFSRSLTDLRVTQYIKTANEFSIARSRLPNLSTNEIRSSVGTLFVDDNDSALRTQFKIFDLDH